MEPQFKSQTLHVDNQPNVNQIFKFPKLLKMIAIILMQLLWFGERNKYADGDSLCAASGHQIQFHLAQRGGIQRYLPRGPTEREWTWFDARPLPPPCVQSIIPLLPSSSHRTFLQYCTPQIFSKIFQNFFQIFFQFFFKIFQNFFQIFFQNFPIFFQNFPIFFQFFPKCFQIFSKI